MTSCIAASHPRTARAARPQADMARDAAALTVSCHALRDLGSAIYAELSPRLNQELEFDPAQAKVAQLKTQCKVRRRVHAGARSASKGDLGAGLVRAGQGGSHRCASACACAHLAGVGPQGDGLARRAGGARVRRGAPLNACSGRQGVWGRAPTPGRGATPRPRRRRWSRCTPCGAPPPRRCRSRCSSCSPSSSRESPAPAPALTAPRRRSRQPSTRACARAPRSLHKADDKFGVGSWSLETSSFKEQAHVEVNAKGKQVKTWPLKAVKQIARKKCAPPAPPSLGHTHRLPVQPWGACRRARRSAAATRIHLGGACMRDSHAAHARASAHVRARARMHVPCPAWPRGAATARTSGCSSPRPGAARAGRGRWTASSSASSRCGGARALGPASRLDRRRLRRPPGRATRCVRASCVNGAGILPAAARNGPAGRPLRALQAVAVWAPGCVRTHLAGD